jgi:small neutral amino acid transporter SnatA (MarC family)
MLFRERGARHHPDHSPHSSKSVAAVTPSSTPAAEAPSTIHVVVPASTTVHVVAATPITEDEPYVATNTGEAMTK